MAPRLSLFSLAALTIMCASCTTTPRLHISVAGMDMELTQSAPAMVNASISPDGRYVLASHQGEAITHWDLAIGTGLPMVKGFNPFLLGFSNFLHYSPNGKYALFARERSPNPIELREIESGKTARVINVDYWLRAGTFSPDGKYILAGGVNGNVNLYDVETGSLVRAFEKTESSILYHNIINSVAYSPDGRFVMAGGRENTIKVWDAKSGQHLNTLLNLHEYRSFLGHPGIKGITISPDSRYALTWGWWNPLKLLTIATGEVVGSFGTYKGMAQEVMSASFSPDGKTIVAGGIDGLIYVWDAVTGRNIRQIDHNKTTVPIGFIGVKFVSFTSDGERIVSAADASIRVWDANTGQELATMVGFVDGEWLVITPEGYYNASENGAQYLKVKINDRDYLVDQFYDVFFRPDIVTAKLKGENVKDLVTITMKDAIQSPPPAIELSGISDSDKPKVKVCYQVKSTGGGIGEVRLFHNGKLIDSDGYYRETARAAENKTITAMSSRAIYDDMRNVSVKGVADVQAVAHKPKGDMFDTCTEIDAVAGDNEVSVTAFNKGNTIQSAVKTAKFNARIPAATPSIYILAIGINEYKDRSITLKYATKDAKEMLEKLAGQSRTIYNPDAVHYRLVSDTAATKNNIIEQINELAKIVKPSDGFILFIAGHGVLHRNQYYILTHDYHGKMNESNMISSNEIVEMSKKIRSLSQLFIFDTCHAGGVDSIIAGLYDARMAVLAKKMGLHIYASANSTQQAIDGYKGNGLFTYTLLDGLNNNPEADKNKDKFVSLVELGDYAKRATSEISRKLGHAQTPYIINFGKDKALYNLNRGQ